jgi:hypothetical protein
LKLSGNWFWNEEAEIIMNNMELKEWVELNLLGAAIWEEMAGKLKEWVQSYKDRWINCEVII